MALTYCLFFWLMHYGIMYIVCYKHSFCIWWANALIMSLLCKRVATSTFNEFQWNHICVHNVGLVIQATLEMQSMSKNVWLNLNCNWAQEQDRFLMGKKKKKKVTVHIYISLVVLKNIFTVQRKDLLISECLNCLAGKLNFYQRPWDLSSTYAVAWEKCRTLRLIPFI